MGAIHDLITQEGKQGALKGDVRREVVEAAAAFMADEDAGTGFLYAGWCQTALPHKRLRDDQAWQVTAENVTLIVETGSRPGPASAPVPGPNPRASLSVSSMAGDRRRNPLGPLGTAIPCASRALS